MENTPNPAPGQLDIGSILSNLSKNDFSFHVTITSLIEVLKDKGIITNEDLGAKAKLVNEELIKQVNLRVPPPDGFTPPDQK